MGPRPQIAVTTATTMRRAGRADTCLCARLFCLYASMTIAAGIKYGVPIEINHWDTGRTPLKQMVDVTNEFGLKVLAEHNFLNHNNIAFSPYGLMGIMVALYEGVDGDSSYEIQRAMQLPWNRKILRVGFRDIHRTLKTYFVPEEGFLAGLALNSENVVFKQSYIDVLRFYGFDIESGQTTTSTTPNTTVTTSPTTTNVDEISTTTLNMENTTADTEETTTNPSETTTEVSPESTTTSTQTTPISTTVKTTISQTTLVTSTTELTPTNANSPDASTTKASITTDQMNGSTSTATDSNTSTTSNTTMSENIVSTTESMTTGSTNTTTTGAGTSSSGTATSSTEMMSSTGSTTTTQNISTSESVTPTTATSTSGSTPNMQNATTTENSGTSESTTSSTEATPSSETTTNTQNTSTTESVTPSTEATPSDSTTDMQNTTTPGNATPSSENMPTPENTMNNTESVSNPTPMNRSMLETLARRKKSIVDYLFTNPPYFDSYPLYRSFDIGPDYSDMVYGGDEQDVYFADDAKKNPPYVGYGGNQMFLVNGIKNVEVTYMSYDATLDYAHLPHLDASALRLPLDSDRYYLLLVLPARRRAGELARLLARMARSSDLSDVYNALRPKRVRALVPSFFVKGHITLTTDLQKLGIRNVFQPRQNDFTPMTSQPGVYVRSIEQAVSVAIRKYSPDETKKIGHAANRQRVYFSATYPFLYFVMDTNINVALMAGKLVDPLNSRIL